MSGNVRETKRLLAVTRGSLREYYLYLTHHRDFFPPECYGASNRSAGLGHPLTLALEGLPGRVETDIANHQKGGALFRKRSWVRRFFDKHQIREGDVIAIERVDKYLYRVYPFMTRSVREGSRIPQHWPPIDPQKPTTVDLFAGCGGLSAGLAKAGFQTLLAVEWDASACETFRANVSPRILQCAIEEIETFPQCDLLAGGPPCQGFSNLGEKIPNDPRRQLWRHFVRALEDAQPLLFIMENVPPLLKSAEYEEIRRTAKGLGYEVDGRILNSADYEVPQLRRRAFVIGSRIGEPCFPRPARRPPGEAGIFDNDDLPVWLTVHDAIADLPTVPDGKNWHIGRNPTALSLKRYAWIPPGGNRWDLPKELMPECWKRKTKGGTDLFGRLWWDRPSVTIRTEFYKPEKGRYLHPAENRPITHREAARLQGFEDSFEFRGKKIEVGRQIGNAVPPPLAYHLGLAAIEHIMSWRARLHAAEGGTARAAKA
jgi:DNA (cytosine-5)-methyltransferase 1